MIGAWWLLVVAAVFFVLGGVVGIVVACIPFSKALRRAREAARRDA